METNRRSLIKTITYRVICIVMMLLIAYFYLKNLTESILFTAIFQGGQAVIYYFHERLWSRIKWGVG